MMMMIVQYMMIVLVFASVCALGLITGDDSLEDSMMITSDSNSMTNDGNYTDYPDIPVPTVLEHSVVYESLPSPPNYNSDATVDPMGMEHVYLVVNIFLHMIQRDHALPNSLNTTTILSTISASSEDITLLLSSHWQDILLQYIGVITIATHGLLLAIIIPVIGLVFWVCRCAGRCGAYPKTYYDKKSDSCKRVSLGILLSFFVIAAVFSTVAAFVTNQYTYSGWTRVSKNIDNSLEDVGGYLEHTGESIEVLLVTNFAEMEEVIGDILDDSGPILKQKLANITEAIAINDLANVIAGLDKVKNNLNSIVSDTRLLDDKVNQLRDGLSRSQKDLNTALQDCTSNTACANFLQEYDLSNDLAMAEEFIGIEFEMPEVKNILNYITKFIEGDVDKKIKIGKEKIDNLETEIEEKIEDIKPKIKSEVRAMGLQLEKQSNQIQAALQQIDIGVIQKKVPEIDDHTLEFVEYRFYIGLGMSCLVLLILFCFIMGLFYGLCGTRPGGYYGDTCCNRGTGANFLTSGVYLTFLFSSLVLLLTTAHFLIGALVDKLVCEPLQQPQQSDVFHQLDQQFLQPHLEQILPGDVKDLARMLQQCHNNNTLYTILQMDRTYNISRLTDWRSTYGIGEYIENLKNKIQLEQLSKITLLSPETSKDLHELAQSNISNINFSKFTTLLENEITKVDLDNFIDRLKVLKDQVYRFESTRSIAPKLENQALWLGTMNKVVQEMKEIVENLKVTVKDLEENSKFKHSSMREAIHSLLNQTSRATKMIQKDGPELISSLTEQYVTETIDIIDDYVARVIDTIEYEVGYCAPLSTSYNATVVAICNNVVDPFNGFWASTGWCMLLFLPCLLLSTSLIPLYRKCEPYPGPLLDTSHHTTNTTNTTTNTPGRGKKGHTRNVSGYLPEYTHARPPPNMQAARFRDMAPSNYGREAAQPPRYSSSPAQHHTGEYDRPPPYYYPGNQQDNKQV